MRKVCAGTAWRPMSGLLLWIATAGTVVAADTAALETVTVTATRIEQPAYEVPASIESREIVQDGLGVNLSESLQGVAGLTARDRQNYAQDTQISIRGFGARSAFGIRGVRLYLDGIPATQPDGQGQVSHFNLATAERVEVLRGPFSALYGNSSGGVIQMFTAEGSKTPEVHGGIAVGSFDTWRASLGSRGSYGIANYNFGYSRFDTNGFRDHSAAERESLQAKLKLDFGGAGRLSLLLNDFESPEAQDPLGLTREQFDADPSQAAPQALQFNTRKSTDQTQAGAIYDFDLSEVQSLRLLGYTGQRSVKQFLAIPIAPQASPRHSGGVVDLDTDYSGTDLRWSYRGAFAQRPFWLVAGMSYDGLSQHRRGYENFVGSALGVQGALRRDEFNDVTSFDQYLQASWDFAARWSLMAGVRHSRIEFESDDRYVTAGNPDDSGQTDYSATSPVAGLMFKASDRLHVYGSYGEGFETPTFAELAYRPDGGAGLNFGLDASRTRNAEVGVKLRLTPDIRAEVTAFHARTEDELAVATNSGGRSTYFNIGETRRRGAEASLQARLAPRLRLELAYTWLDAEVREGYLICTSAPCSTPTTPVAAGNALPGVPRASAYAMLSFGADTGWQASLTARHVDSVPVNDVNGESAPSYSLVDLGSGYAFELPHWRVRSFVEVSNVFDADYVGSVIVNDSNGRYYEPGPGRSVLAGVRLDWRA